MNPSLFARWLSMAVLFSSVAAGCKHNEGDSVVLTGEGTRLSSEAIDADPMALLPANPVVLGWVDAQAFFRSSFGGEINRLATKYVPLGENAGFVPQRDLRNVVGGVYSLAGADVVAVAQGDFNPDAIRAAAEQKSTSPSGVALVHSKYAGNDVYTANNVGFTVVTKHTMLVGNETGMRRALDRIRDNRLRREIPEWMTKLVETPKASMVFAGDVTSQPQVAALARSAPFLNGLNQFRVLGNFEEPGINFAGTLTYADAASAAAGAASLKSMGANGRSDERARDVRARLAVATTAGKIRRQSMSFVLGVDAKSLIRLSGQLL